MDTNVTIKMQTYKAIHEQAVLLCREAVENHSGLEADDKMYLDKLIQLFDSSQSREAVLIEKHAVKVLAEIIRTQGHAVVLAALRAVRSPAPDCIGNEVPAYAKGFKCSSPACTFPGCMTPSGRNITEEDLSG